jgi:AraC family transcriptional regulator
VTPDLPPSASGTCRVVRLEALRLVGARGRFTRETQDEIPTVWARFAPRMGTVPGRVDPRTSYGVCEVVDGALDYTACVEVDSLERVPEGLVGFEVPEGVYAVFTHEGPIAGIGRTWDLIHGRWLREAGLVKEAGADFERYDVRWDPATASGPVDVFVRVRR